MFRLIVEPFRAVAGIISGRMLSALFVGLATFLLLFELISQQNIFIIRDGEELIVYNTYTTTAREALREAGIEYDPGDIVELDDGDKVGAVSEVVIQRSHYVTVLADGKSYRVSSFGDTVSGVLARARVKLGNLDEVSSDLETVSYDGMEIRVTRYSRKNESETRPIEFQTVRRDNNTLAKGTEKVVQEGKAGEMTLLYELTYRDGMQTGRRFIGEVVSVEPVEHIIEVGTKLPEPTPPLKQNVQPELSQIKVVDNGGVITVEGVEYTYKKKLEVKATAYTTEGYKNKLTAIGSIARVGAIAVDPKVIPLRSKVYVTSADDTWVYGMSTCEDTGRLIKGNRIDLFFNTRSECYNFGVRKAIVYVME